MVRHPRRRMTSAARSLLATACLIPATLAGHHAAHGQDNRHGARWGAPDTVAIAAPSVTRDAHGGWSGGATASGRPVPVIMAPGERFSAVRMNATSVVAPATPQPVTTPPAASPIGVSALTASRPGTRPHRKVGAPYEVNGIWYVPARDDDYRETGVASWYGPNFHGRDTANGEVFDQDLMTAAHPTLPIPSIVRVTNEENGRSALVRVNDRGPFARDRIIDLSRRAAQALDFEEAGTARVTVEFIADAPLPGEAPSAGFRAAVANAQSAMPAVRSAETRVRPRSNHAAVRMRTDSREEAVYVQAAAFSSRGRAQSVLADFHGMPGRIENARVNGRNVYRVLIGPWRSDRDAENARRSAAARGFSDARFVRGF